MHSLRRDDYDYPQSGEAQIAARLGGMVSPYDGTRFESLAESDIEHIIATSEAHDSGLCAATFAVRARFARDLDNLTLATPKLNRFEKVARRPNATGKIDFELALSGLVNP